MTYIYKFPLISLIINWTKFEEIKQIKHENSVYYTEMQDKHFDRT